LPPFAGTTVKKLALGLILGRSLTAAVAERVPLAIRRGEFMQLSSAKFYTFTASLNGEGFFSDPQPEIIN
jgi:hypothetical protein